jgi:galactokinase
MYFPEYGLALLWIDTLARPESNGEIAAARRAECAAAARELGVSSLRELEHFPMPLRAIEHLSDPILRRRARHVLHENDRVRLVLGELAGTGPAHERFVAVGKAMYRSHASLDLDFDLSSELLNLTVDTAFEAGALGAHLTGWGRGGAILALVRRAEIKRIADAVDAAYAARSLPLPHYAVL